MLVFHLLAIGLLLLRTTSAFGKLRHPTVYQVHPDTVELQSDHQETIFLNKNQVRTYHFRSVAEYGHLSATLTPCSTAVRWSFTANVSANSIVTRETHTLSVPPTRGLHSLVVQAVDGDSYVHVYVSTEPGGPQALQNADHHRLSVLNTARKRRLLVHWEPSLVDPQVTEYCLVVSAEREFKALCAAEASKFGVQPDRYVSDDPAIICVGKHTHYTLSNLKHMQAYYLSVFAQNRQSNLTYAYGSVDFVYNKKIEPIHMERNKAVYVNLKKYQGDVVFRYKIRRNSAKKSLNLFVSPCGGSVYLQIKSKHETILNKTQIDKSDRFDLYDLKSGWYNIKISATKQEFRNVGVEILASTSEMLSRVHTMPKNTTVQQLMRSCDSATIGWLSPPGQETANYCFTVKETRPHGDEDDLSAFQWPNQCGLERRLRKSADLKYCKPIKRNSRQMVVTERISQLKAGRSYMVQVTVKKAKGKTLAYDVVKVFTAPTCHIWH